MNLLTKAAVIAAIPLSLAMSLPSAAVAANTRTVCGPVAGFELCAEDQEEVDTLTITWTDGEKTQILVQCETGNWFRTGYELERGYVNKIIEDWCW